MFNHSGIKPSEQYKDPWLWTRFTKQWVVVAAIAAIALSTCFGSLLKPFSAAAALSNKPIGTLTIVTAEPPQTFDPIQAPNSTVDQMALNNYDALVQFTAAERTHLYPALAVHWSVSRDGRHYVFVLRKGVHFHSGDLFTAQDVKFTLDRIKKLDTGIASEIQPYQSSRVLGPNRIEVNLSQPYAPLIGALSRVYILDSRLVHRHLGSDMGQTWLSNHDAGSGPYVLDKYIPGQLAQFSAFSKYWRGWSGHHVNTVIYKFLPEAATQRAALESGAANIAMNIAKADLPAFKHRPGFKVIASNTLVQYYIFFNTAAGPTKNRLVREALAMAYDYQTHLHDILDGYGKPADGPLPVEMPCHNSHIIQPKFDLQAAQRLLAKAGYHHLTLRMEYLPVLEEEKKSFELFQSDLAQIGITLKPIPTTFPAYMAMLKSVKTTPDLGAVYAFPLFPDPNEVMYINFDSRFIGNGYNYGRYSNRQVDRLVERAQRLTSMRERCPLYRQAQALVARDYVAINVSDPQYTTVIGPGVHGYAYNPAHHQTENTYDISVYGR